MSYGYYQTPDGDEHGYTIPTGCNAMGCSEPINRGHNHLCGLWPSPLRDQDASGCGGYFCGYHIAYSAHACANPPISEENLDP